MLFVSSCCGPPLGVVTTNSGVIRDCVWSLLFIGYQSSAPHLWVLTGGREFLGPDRPINIYISLFFVIDEIALPFNGDPFIAHLKLDDKAHVFEALDAENIL
jgi:hypothetical protein